MREGIVGNMYGADGVEYRVVTESEEGVVCYRQVEFFDGDFADTGDGDVVIIPKGGLFREPPVGRVDEEIRKRREDLSDVNGLIVDKKKSLDLILKRIAEEKVAFQEIKDKASNYSALNRVFDFIDGKITHYVRSEYGTVEIHERGKDPKTDDKLLSLYGASNGDLSWRLSKYSGGGSEKTVIPCLSHDEAKDVARVEIVRLLEEGRDSKRLLESTKKYGVEIPQKYEDDFLNARANSVRERIKFKKKEVDEEINALQALIKRGASISDE